MRIPASFRPSPRFARLGAIGLFGLSLAACGNDVTRFNDDPNGNPYRRSDVTNSAQSTPAPTAQIESRPLGAPANVNGTPVYGPTVYGSNTPPPQNYSNPPQPGYPQNYSNAPSSVPAAPAPVSRAPVRNDKEQTGTVAVGDED
jgi:hypothetical protein